MQLGVRSKEDCSRLLALRRESLQKLVEAVTPAGELSSEQKLALVRKVGEARRWMGLAGW